MNSMKKMKRIMILLVMLAAGFCLQISVCAASNANPLKEMPTKSSVIIATPLGKGCDFFTPEYKSDFKMTATSSNRKVATVKVYNFHKDNKYYKGYEITRKGYGSTKIKVTVKIGKKTYTKTCKYSFYKYSNPLSSLKIGKNNYAKKVKAGKLTVDQSKMTGKISIKPKKGYKLVDLRCNYGNNMQINSKKIKNNSKLPAKTKDLFIRLQNTKTKATITVWVQCSR